MNNAPRILIAPLDWGLGHATRCIPIIKSFLENGCEVFVAGTLTTNSILKLEFPGLTFLDLSGYNVHYSNNKKNLPFVIFKQIPKIISQILNEHSWIKKQIQLYQIDAVISDNRYGLFTSKVPSIFVTHQLQIQVPQSKMFENMVKKMNAWFISKYKSCWIVDYENDPMAGILSKNDFIENAQHLGNCSRFEHSEPRKVDYDVLVILSGPEPQRSIFEQKIIESEIDKRILIVQGRPTLNTSIQKITTKIDLVSHLNSNELMQLIQSVHYVVNRSGYTTVMDMIKLGKHAIYIPTPGQTEQEYLAEYLAINKWGISMSQEEFDLKLAIEKFDSSQFCKYPAYNLYQYSEVISNFVKELKSKQYASNS